MSFIHFIIFFLWYYLLPQAVIVLHIYLFFLLDEYVTVSEEYGILILLWLSQVDDTLQNVEID